MFGPRVGISMTSGQLGEAKRTTRTKLRQVIEQDAKAVAAGAKTGWERVDHRSE